MECSCCRGMSAKAFLALQTGNARFCSACAHRKVSVLGEWRVWYCRVLHVARQHSTVFDVRACDKCEER